MHKRTRGFVLVGLLVALLLGGVVSYYASSSPDGLEKVASEQGFAETATDHELADSPLADYSTRGVENPRLSSGLAGVVGVTLTFVVMGGVAMLVRRRGDTSGPKEG